MTGQTFVMQGSEDAGFVSDLVPAIAAELAAGTLHSREAVEDEIDLMLRSVRTFWEMEPDQVMRMSSAITARCTEMLVHLHRVEGKREWSRIRTMQVQPLLAEMDRQFKTASRLLEVRRQDLLLETGRS
jgi:hypothetical protein